MTFSSGPNPLAYTGINPKLQPDVLRADRPPTSNDIRDHGTHWVDQTTNPHRIYITPDSGIWLQLGIGGGTLDTLTGDGGPPVVAVGSNINVQGGGAGAITFTNGGVATLSAQVNVDNSTIQIVANQLVAAGITLLGPIQTPTVAPFEADFPSIAIADNTSYFIRAEISGWEDVPGAGTACAGSVEAHVFRTGGGTAQISVNQNLFKVSVPQPQPAGALDFNFVVAGNNVILRVFGTTLTLNWNARITIVQTP